LPAVILRPGQIFGPGAEKVPPSGTIGIAGCWLVVGSGAFPLPLVYVEDVVDALLLAAEREDVVGSIFHLVDEAEAVSQSEYLNLCRSVNGNRPRILHVPRTALYAAAVCAEVMGRLLNRKLPLSRYRLRSAVPLGPCDCSAARERLGWKPRVGTREGLRRVFGNAAPSQPEALVSLPELMTAGSAKTD